MTEESRIDRLEGMLVAHRQLIALLVAEVSREAPHILTALEDRLTSRDGQEDPGAVPTDGLAMELALAEEMQRMRNIAEISRAD